MTVTNDPDNEQAALWNGVAGRAWVDAQDVLDQMFQPIEDRLVGAVVAETPGAVLDVGCGTGSTTLAVARRMGPNGRAIGVDLSEPMIATARTRAERNDARATFICANAQTHAFEPAGADSIVSRFGVMFFDDPVRAFANLRRAATAGASLHLVVWRSAAENPFMTTAERAAGPLLPNIPPRRAGGPGQFAFADRDRVARILADSGWASVDLAAIDVDCTFPERELVRYLTRLGPVGMILHDADDATRAQVIDTVRAAFAPYVDGPDIRFTAACWMISGRASAVR